MTKIHTKPYEGEVKGVILDVTHGSTKDGPGWRSVVYFKGCNAVCPWCSSPEGMSFSKEILLFPEREKYIERLLRACNSGAISVAGEKSITDRDVCAECKTFACVAQCLDGSRETAGRDVTVDGVVREILPYKKFDTHYGVTLTGGEATCQWEFYVELLKACRVHGFHTAVETNGMNPRLAESFPMLDLVICDLKIMDPEKHRKLLGQPLAPVLENIRAAADAAKPLWVRIPVVPGVNDGWNLESAAAFLAPMKDKLAVETLGYHNLGAYRWTALGREYVFSDLKPATEAQLESWRSVFRKRGLNVIVT